MAEVLTKTAKRLNQVAKNSGAAWPRRCSLIDFWRIVGEAASLIE
jgi:hypothetical protein